jgi:hypothetical protein
MRDAAVLHSVPSLVPEHGEWFYSFPRKSRWFGHFLVLNGGSGLSNWQMANSKWWKERRKKL